MGNSETKDAERKGKRQREDKRRKGKLIERSLVSLSFSSRVGGGDANEGREAKDLKRTEGQIFLNFPLDSNFLRF